jgi:hypothetical protein
VNVLTFDIIIDSAPEDVSFSASVFGALIVLISVFVEI